MFENRAEPKVYPSPQPPPPKGGRGKAGGNASLLSASGRLENCANVE